MKIVLLFTTLLAMTSAFVPTIMTPKTTTTQLNVERRDFCFTAALGLLGVMPSAANAKPAVRLSYPLHCLKLLSTQNLNAYSPYM